MEKRIKQIIKEEVDRVMIEQKLKEDFDYLSPFNYMGHVSVGDIDKWIFNLSHKKNDLKVVIKKNGTQWYWVINHDGKGVENDAEIKWGPYNSYEELKSEVNNKIENNMQLSTGNLRNGKYDIENEDLIHRIKELIKNGDKIMSLKDGNLDDVKKLYNLALQYQGLDDIDFIIKLKDEYNSVRGVSNVLNKLPQLDYYKKLEKFQGY